MQRLPTRVPDRRRHGENESRVPAPLQAAPWPHAKGQTDCLSAAIRADRIECRAAHQRALESYQSTARLRTQAPLAAVEGASFQKYDTASESVRHETQR